MCVLRQFEAPRAVYIKPLIIIRFGSRVKLGTLQVCTDEPTGLRTLLYGSRTLCVEGCLVSPCNSLDFS